MDMAELLGDAEQRGFTLNFALEDDGVHCPESGDCFGPDDVKAIYSRTVDSGTDPGDDATIYLIETYDGRKGYLMISDSFHVDPRKAAFLRHLVRGRGTTATP
ncbi:MAG: hypothetical protein WD795_06370 [Woeseia sp.]